MSETERQVEWILDFYFVFETENWKSDILLSFITALLSKLHFL